MTYPDNEVVTTSYNSMGLPTKLASNAPATLINGSTYAAGNLTSCAGNTLVWDAENRLQEVKSGSTTVESYLYDDNGIRTKRTAGGASTYFPSPYYELAGSTPIKYYLPSRPGGTRSGQALAASVLRRKTAPRYTTCIKTTWVVLS